MRVLSRSIFREIAVSSALGVVLFTFVLFLQKAGKLFTVLVRYSGPPKTVAYLFSLAFPLVLTYTIPVGVLAGVLLGLSRMSGDGEITALRATGVPGRSVAKPVLTFAVLATLIAACCSIWLTPWAFREQYRIMNTMAATQMTAEIQARVFDEQFPKKILYVGDVPTPNGGAVRWRKVFLADVTPPEDRPKSAVELGDAPSLTVAEEAIVTPDIAHNRIQLSLLNSSKYEVEKDATKYNESSSPRGEQILEAQKPAEIKASQPSVEMDTWPLYKLAYKDPTIDNQRKLEARIDLHQRLAFPLACLMLALAGIPLGVSSRKGGKSGAFVLTVGVAFAYWIGGIALNNLARQGTIPVPLAVWLPNAFFSIMGIVMMLRLEKPGDRDLVGTVREWLTATAMRLRDKLPTPRTRKPAFESIKMSFLPQLIDGYVLNSFIFYLAILLVTFVLMIHVFTFFELLNDIIRNRIPMAKVLEYLLFLTPELIYKSAPVSVLVAVLITFGVFTKYNEVTAFKACGVSAYRLAMPVLVASAVLSAGLFAFDHYYVPAANRRQDALRNYIKGKTTQTYARADLKFIYGRGDRVYYYKGFDAAESVMVGVSVYELDPKTFKLAKHIQAERARWEPSVNMWIFQNGWSREFKPHGVIEFHDFRGDIGKFPELDEPPSWFVREVMQYFEMNFQTLDAYIREVRQSGFNTVPLQVQYHKKFAVPLLALIMALIAIPFSFVVGSRGAMAGVGISFGIAISYFSITVLFEQIGNLGQLPPQVAAWSPDAIFTLTGLYFLARLRT